MNWLQNLHSAQRDVRDIRKSLYHNTIALESLGSMPLLSDELFRMCEDLTYIELNITNAINAKLDEDESNTKAMSVAVLSGCLALADKIAS